MDLWVLILFAHIFGTALRPVLQAIKGIQHSVSKIQFFERKSLVFTLFFSFYFYKQIMRMVAETPIPTLRFILLFTNHSFWIRNTGFITFVFTTCWYPLNVFCLRNSFTGSDLQIISKLKHWISRNGSTLSIQIF